MNIAQGSLEECRYYLILAKDLGYGDTAVLTSHLEEVSKMLEAYSSSILFSDSRLLNSDFWLLFSERLSKYVIICAVFS